MLSAAGFAPIHTETDLSAPEMTSVRKALNLMLQKQKPYPAFVVDRYWNLILTNHAAIRLLTAFIDPNELQRRFYQDGKINLMRVLFHPQGLRPFVMNWEQLAGRLLQRLHREAVTGGENEPSNLLLKELLNYPAVFELWQTSRRLAQSATSQEPTQHTLLLTTHFKRDYLELKFFSTIATLGTPYDITLQELRIECLFPADQATEQNWSEI